MRVVVVKSIGVCCGFVRFVPLHSHLATAALYQYTPLKKAIVNVALLAITAQ